MVSHENFVLYVTNRFHDAVCLFINRSQTTLKCWKEPKVIHFDVICNLLLNRRTVTCRFFLEYPLMDHFLNSRKLSSLKIIKVWRM